MKSHLRPLLTFCVIGVVNTAAYYAVYLGLHPFLPYLMAHIAGWCVGIAVSYLLNCRFTYRVRPTWRKALVYPLSNLPNIVLSTLGVVLMVEVFGWEDEVAPLIATIVAIPISYTLARLILLGPRRDEIIEQSEQIAEALEPPTPPTRRVTGEGL